MLDLGPALGQYQHTQHLLVALDRHTDTDHQLACRGLTECLSRFSPQGTFCLCEVIQTDISPVDEDRQLFFIRHQHGDDVIEKPQGQFEHGFPFRRRQILNDDQPARPQQILTVGNQRTIGCKQARAGFRRLHQTAHHAADNIRAEFLHGSGIRGDSTFTKGGGKQFALHPQCLGFRGNQAVAIFIQIEQARRKQAKGYRIHIENTPGQGRKGTPPPGTTRA